MMIAVPIDDIKQDPDVAVSFGRAQSFYLYNAEDKSTRTIENAAAASAGGAGIQAAQLLVDHGVTAVVTPRCGKNAANILLAAGVKLLKGAPGLNAKANVALAANGELEELTAIHEGFHGR